jgi:hypothetical protein
LTPGSGIGKKSRSGYGYGMNNPHHISESLKKQFFGLKYFNSFMWIRDLGWKKLRIRDPGINIPDPQHWMQQFLSKGAN